MTRVAFQGERGAYSELAVRAHFGAADAIACRQFTDVIDLLASSAVEHAVLPVENSLAGAVPGVAELLLDQRVGVDSELWLPIHHCLLVLPGALIATIDSVLSHPVALAQCTRFFANHPGLTPISWFDTAGAAQHVARAGDAALAAIASEAAAEHYGLEILERNLEDRADNRTRFVVLSARAESAR
ncbi:MAG TPA: prephenate dehydratase domain-containing protein [Longimicrobiales bacterium]